MTEIRCGEVLSLLPNRLPNDYTHICDCCQRAWVLRERTRWLTYMPWIKSVPAHDKVRVWVRMSKFSSLLTQSIQERG